MRSKKIAIYHDLQKSEVVNKLVYTYMLFYAIDAAVRGEWVVIMWPTAVGSSHLQDNMRVKPAPSEVTRVYRPVSLHTGRLYCNM